MYMCTLYIIIKNYMYNYALYIYSFNKLFSSGMMVPPPTATDHPAKTPISNMKGFFFFRFWPGLSKRLPNHTAYCCCP